MLVQLSALPNLYYESSSIGQQSFLTTTGSYSMLGTKTDFDEALLEQLAEHKTSAAEISPNAIDCYPYATRGVLWALLFSGVFWGCAVSLLMLVF